jgi:pimeloyl-ACP methyl ester carboxylesterase
VAQFILRHLRGEEHTIPDAEHADGLPICSERQLWTTFTGNVHLDGLGKGPFDLIRERTEALARQRPPLNGASLRAAVLKTLGETEESLASAPRNVRTDGAEVFWESVGAVPLRLLCSGAGESVALLVHEDGCAGAEHSPLFSALKRTALRLARVDLRGMGISAAPEPEPNAPFLTPLLQSKQSDLARLVLHQGRTLLGLRTADLLQAAQVVSLPSSLQAGQPAPQVDLIAEGGIGFAALLAAALAPGVFRRVVLFRTPLSWRELTTGAGRVWNFAHFLPGVLEHFDTRDLTNALPRHKVLWLNPTDGTGAALPLERAATEHPNVTFGQVYVESELAGALTQ